MTRKKPFVSVCNDDCHLALMKWARKCGITHSKLVPARFHGTGRGLLSSRSLKEGSVVISIPEHILITRSSVACTPLCSLLSCQAHQLGVKEVLCLYIVTEYHKKSNSYFYHYIQSLPRTFSTFSYLSSQIIVSAPNDLKKRILKQRSDVELTETKIREALDHIFAGNCSECVQARSYLEKIPFTGDDIKWAWNVVNTRSVYMKSSNHCDARQSQNGNLALAPVLDLLNHSDKAKVTAGFNYFHRCYEIITEKPYKRGEQIFINYGFHDNRTLCEEYGFFLQDNVADNIPVPQSCVLPVLPKYYQYDDVQLKLKTLEKLGLDWMKVTYNSINISWMFDMLLKVFSSDCCNWRDLEKLLDENFEMTEKMKEQYICIKDEVMNQVISINTQAMAKMSQLTHHLETIHSDNILISLIEHECVVAQDVLKK